MPIFSRNGENVLFVHIPKTGGTTIEYLVRDAGWELSFFYDGSGAYSRFPLVPCTPQHMHLEALDRYVDWSKISRAFTVVRNPVTRFVSEFFFQKPRFIQAKIIEKQDFERWAFRSLDRIRDDPFCFDNHLRPQSEFVRDGIRAFRFEDGLEAPLREIFPRDFGALEAAPQYRQAKTDKTPLEVPKRVLRAIQDLYLEDFHNFGYNLT